MIPVPPMRVNASACVMTCALPSRLPPVAPRPEITSNLERFRYDNILLKKTAPQKPLFVQNSSPSPSPSYFLPIQTRHNYQFSGVKAPAALPLNIHDTLPTIPQFTSTTATTLPYAKMPTYPQPFLSATPVSVVKPSPIATPTFSKQSFQFTDRKILTVNVENILDASCPDSSLQTEYWEQEEGECNTIEEGAALRLIGKPQTQGDNVSFLCYWFHTADEQEANFVICSSALRIEP
ncbi:hypothetical protein Pelo_15259 [Pelomyxa schiedti]|nr:hypothetical protein Pelo_15259 [Pelomyxa schiedti]